MKRGTMKLSPKINRSISRMDSIFQGAFITRLFRLLNIPSRIVCFMLLPLCGLVIGWLLLRSFIYWVFKVRPFILFISAIADAFGRTISPFQFDKSSNINTVYYKEIAASFKAPCISIIVNFVPRHELLSLYGDFRGIIVYRVGWHRYGLPATVCAAVRGCWTSQPTPSVGRPALASGGPTPAPRYSKRRLESRARCSCPWSRCLSNNDFHSPSVTHLRKSIHSYFHFTPR